MTTGSPQPARVAAPDRVVVVFESVRDTLADLVASADSLRVKADSRGAHLSAGKLVAVAAAARDMLVRLRIRGSVPRDDFFTLVDAARIVLCRQRLLLQQLAREETSAKRGQ